MVIEINKLIIEDPIKQNIIYWALVDYSMSYYILENNYNKIIITRDMLYILKKHLNENNLRFI